MKFPRLKKNRGGDAESSTTTSGAIKVGGKFKSRMAKNSATKQQQEEQPSSQNTKQIPTDLPKMEDLIAGNSAVASASVICGGGAAGGGGDENGGVSMANASAGTSLPSKFPPPPPVFDFNRPHPIDNDAGSPPPPPPPLSARSPLSPRGYPTSPRSPTTDGGGALNHHRATSSQSSAYTGYTSYENNTVLSIHSHQVELSAVPGHKRWGSAGGGAAPRVSPVAESPISTDAVPINERLNVQTTMAASAVPDLHPDPEEAEEAAMLDEGLGHCGGTAAFESALKIYLPRSPMAREALAEVQDGKGVGPATRADATATASADVDKADKHEAPSRYAVLKVDTGVATDASIDDDAQAAAVEAAINPSRSEHSNQNVFGRVRSTGTLKTVLSMRSEVLVEDFDTLESTRGDETEATGEREESDHDNEDSDEDRDSDDVTSVHDMGSNKKRWTVKETRSRSGSRRNRRSKVSEKKLRGGHRRACKHLESGDFDNALLEFESILGLLMSSLGESHRRVGTALHNVGIVNIRANNLDDAVDAIEEAVRIRKDVHGPDHPKVADSLVELGIALLSQRDFEDSIEVFKDALELREADLAEEARHGTDEDRIYCVLQVSKVLNNIGCVYFEFGSLHKAQKTYEDALEMQREAIGETEERDPEYKPANLSLASTLCNLGYVHMDNSDWDEALDSLDEAYSIQSRYLSEGSALTLNTLENLAYANYEERNLEVAMETFKEVLLGQADLYGKYDIACAQTRSNIACVHIRSCEYEEALEQLDVAEDILLDVLGSKSRRLKKIRDMIACVQYEMLKFPSVGEMFNRAMTKGRVKNPITQNLLCSCGDGEVSELEAMRKFQPARPDSSSKLSGHKISFA